MARTLFFFLKLAVLVAVAVWLADRPGEVTLQWLGYRVDTTVGVLLAAIFILVVLVALLYRLWRFVMRSPRQIARRRVERRRRDGYRALTQGMVAVAAGDAAEAKRQSHKAAALLNEPPLTMLLAAQAAQLDGDEAAARRYFEAMLERKETAFLGVRGLLMQALRANDRPAALALAERALKERPNTPWAAESLLDLQLRDGRWSAAAATLRQATKLKAVDDAKGRRIRAVMLAEEAREEVAAAAPGMAPPRAIAALEEAARLAPDLVPARALWAELLARSGRRRQAAKLIEKAWAEAPHPLLAAAYARLEPAESAIERARRFEALAARKPDQPASHRAAGEAALAAGLVGEARRHFQAALDLDGAGPPTAGFARDMARLEESEGGDAAAVRRWLLRAAEAPADPSWICESCGLSTGDWRARCPHCGAFDALRWRTAPRPAAALLPPGDSLGALVPVTPALPPAAAVPASPPPPPRPPGRRPPLRCRPAR
ncbi:MAG: heme biosynthesis HemY N-terminal domain-containing protein [Dongiaceae bacterium]